MADSVFGSGAGCGLGGEFAGDCWSDAYGGLEAYLAAQGVDGVFDYGEPQAGAAAGAAAAGGIDLMQNRSKTRSRCSGGDADSGIGDGEGDDAF